MKFNQPGTFLNIAVNLLVGVLMVVAMLAISYYFLVFGGWLFQPGLLAGSP